MSSFSIQSHRAFASTGVGMLVYGLEARPPVAQNGNVSEYICGRDAQGEMMPGSHIKIKVIRPCVDGTTM